jgi:cysteine sulfinate desulfinase/cysteine desulfurase-like protein
LVASAHKFHGPKGVGFAFVQKKFRFTTIIFMVVNKRKRASWNRSSASNCRNGKSFGAFYANLEKKSSIPIENI